MGPLPKRVRSPGPLPLHRTISCSHVGQVAQCGDRGPRGLLVCRVQRQALSVMQGEQGAKRREEALMARRAPAARLGSGARHEGLVVEAEQVAPEAGGRRPRSAGRLLWHPKPSAAQALPQRVAAGQRPAGQGGQEVRGQPV